MRKLLFIFFVFIAGPNLKAQQGLTFNKVLNFSGRLEDNFHWIQSSNCSNLWKHNDSFTNISDTFTVPNAKIWKIEFIDIDTLNPDMRFRYFNGATCGFIGWTPGVYDIYYNIYFNNVDINNRKDFTPIWLSEGSQLVVNVNSSEFGSNPQNWWFDKYTGKFGMTYVISILEFKVD